MARTVFEVSPTAQARTGLSKRFPSHHGGYWPVADDEAIEVAKHALAVTFEHTKG